MSLLLSLLCVLVLFSVHFSIVRTHSISSSYSIHSSVRIAILERVTSPTNGRNYVWVFQIFFNLIKRRFHATVPFLELRRAYNKNNNFDDFQTFKYLVKTSIFHLTRQLNRVQSILPYFTVDCVFEQQLRTRSDNIKNRLKEDTYS